MANVLPQGQLQIVKRERRMRLAVFVLVFLAVTELLGSIFLIPSLWVARIKKQSVALQVETVAQLIEQKEQDEITTTLRRTRDMLAALRGVVTHPRPTVYSDRLAAHAGSAVGIHHVAYVVNAAGVVTSDDHEESALTEAPVAELALEGVARDREALLAFVRRIERDEVFSSVELPVAHLAERTNIPFTLTIAVVDPRNE